MARFRFDPAAVLVAVFLFLGVAGSASAAPPQAAASPDKNQGVIAPRLRIVPGLEEPLIATGPTTAREDADLDAAIAGFRNPATPPADFTDSAKPFTEFLAAHPGSAWRLAILTNLGLGYYHAGYFTRATTAWEEAWAAGRDATTPQAKALADRAVGELARMHARVGHAEELETIFTDLGSRPISGPATELITGAREGLWLFRNEPGTSYLCGPKALQNLLTALKAPAEQISLVEEARSGPHGFSLAQVAELADRAGLAYRLIYRAPGQAIPVPSVVNWKLHHYAAIVGEQDGRYHIKDPTFGGGDLWVSKAAIDEETSGYFLVPASAPPDTAWREASATEARQVYGMGNTTQNETGATKCQDKNKSGGTGTGPVTQMCLADAKAMLVSLSLNDTPVGYDPPRGPSTRISLTYNQREANQPAVFGFFNVSPKWTLSALSWVQDNPSSPGQSVLRYAAGGGAVNYSTGTTYNASTGAFSPERQGQAVLVRIPATGAVSSYELRMTDGSKQVFAHADGATTAPRRMFLTQIVDTAGNALTFHYDNQLRLTAITDATGRDTTFSYGAANPLLVTAITDPFGRHADLTYNASGRLESITDVIGITSSFTYDAGGLVNAMTTPYGTSTFVYGQNQAGTNSRFLETTDPMGFTDRLEFRHLAPGIATSDPTPPTGLTRLNNGFLNYRNSFYWDQHVYPVTHTDYTKARLTHWLHNPASQTSPIIESTKEPLERRVWRNYPGQSSSFNEGTAGTPTAIARVLDDGTTQLSRFTYNAIGKPLTITDPLGRVTRLTYAANNIDLLKVEQKTSASSFSTVAAFTWNSHHRPLTYTDAAGQTTAFTYNDAGQVLTATNALSETTRYEYDGVGYLTRIVNANNATAASFTYDGFGRVATRTDSEGHTVSLEYDDLDRVTKVSYPDGTNTSYVWDKLDLASVTDRLTRTTHYVHDANRRLTSVTDPLGRTTAYGYYENGVLKSITDPNGKTTSWDIDIQSRPTAKRYADGTKTIIAYETTTSRLKTLTDALNQAKNFTYSLDDRLTGLTYANALTPTPGVTFAHDAFFPRVASMTDGNGATTYQYKAIGAPGALQLGQEDGPFQNDAIVYNYDALGRVANRSVGGSAETFTYDALDRLTGGTNDLGQLTYGYLGQTGQLTSQQLGAAVSSTWTYDSNVNDRRLKSIAHSGATRGYQLTTNPESIITGITETAGAGSAFPPQNWTYAYDDADRLRAAQASSGQFAYDLDPADNLTRIATPTDSTSLSYNDVNEIEQADGTPFVYDPSGNLTDDGIRIYKWDAENRLAEIGYKAVPGKKTVFRYNGYGQRTAIIETGSTGTVETRYLWCGDALCQARSASDTISRRYFVEGEVWPQAATKLYYAQDHLDSVRDVLVAQTGSRAAAYDYEPYGKPSQTAGRISVDFRYAGMFYHQASGLYLTNYRAYDPVTARWLSRDPIGETGGLNLYGYVGGSPVNFTDRKGLFADILLDAAFIIYDLVKLATDSCNVSENLIALGLDIAGAAIPGATGLGAGFKAANRAADTAQVAGTVVRAGEQAAKGVGEASSLANAARLRGQLAGQEIAGGHAFEKHVLNQGEFKGLGVRTREQFAHHIENVVNNPTASRQLSGGRSAYWQESSGTVVIRNPRAADGGTAFQPTNGRAYFDGLR